MRKNVIIGGLIVAIIVATAVVLVTGNNDKQASTTNMPEDHSMAQQESSKQSTEQQTNASSSSEAVAADNVKISNYAYSPAVIKVKVGQTVKWTNEDSVQHDVMAETMSADAPASELLAKGESYSFTFKKAGTYKYYCSPHPYMKGTVIVEE